ncbi:transporter substrate-binding domain-containing protein, partial [Halomonas campaniensis]|uniref:transporter substrate-binding domain-containing protein n=1 Tax=Halomonas campaniensis TaxID=213554 RepID=UPI003970A0D0
MTIPKPSRPRHALLAVGLLLTLSPDAIAETLRVGVYHNPPKLLLDESGHPGGILGELLAAMAEQEGWQIETRPCSWQACVTALEAGELDLLPDVAWSEARAETMAFHREPVLHSWSQVYQRPGLSLDAIVDLDGRRVAVLEGSIQQDFLEHLAESFGVSPTLITVSSFEDPESLREKPRMAGREYVRWP